VTVTINVVVAVATVAEIKELTVLVVVFYTATPRSGSSGE